MTLTETLEGIRAGRIKIAVEVMRGYATKPDTGMDDARQEYQLLLDYNRRFPHQRPPRETSACLMSGDPDAAERHAWQARDAAALLDMLSLAKIARLRPVAWRMSPAGGLVGEVSFRDPVRETFDQWALFLVAHADEVQRWPERSVDGRVHLHLNCRYGAADVALIGDIEPEEASSGS